MEQIIYSLQDHRVIASVVSFFIVVLETFVPILPLVAIVGANAFVLGLWLGFFMSWFGSVLGSTVLFLLSSKFSHTKVFKKFSGHKVDRVTRWIQKQGFNMIFIAYLCPFIPDFLVTVASGISDMKLTNFLPGMVLGKFIMFILISYVGNDAYNFFTNPTKVFLLVLLVASFWILGNKINKKINI